MTTYALDVYGTLINPLAISQKLNTAIGDDAARFSQLWRDKQLEYSFRRGLMARYMNFSVCTQQALDYTCAVTGHDLSDEFRQSLLDHYTRLPAFEETVAALQAFKMSGASLYGFSNGLPSDLQSLFKHAGIADLVDGIVSVHDVESFKPSPVVYEHFNRVTDSSISETWLVSSNPFDICGARAAGWNAAWVQRDPKTVFDPWEFQPSKVIHSLSELIAS